MERKERVKVRVLKDFFDKERNLELVKKDAVLEVSRERAEKLEKIRIAKIIQEEERKG